MPVPAGGVTEDTVTSVLPSVSTVVESLPQKTQRRHGELREKHCMVLVDANPDISVQEREYKRLLGFPPDHEPGERARELMDWARTWYRENGKPWVYARSAKKIALNDGQVRIERETFSSKRLRHQLVHVEGESAILVAVSAGGELEEQARQLWEEGKPDEYFFLEIFGSALVEHLITFAAFRFCEWGDREGVAILPHDSPGYPGWEISEQSRLLDILRGENEIPGKLQALESGMLRPKKSLLGVFGVTRNVAQVQRLTALIPCQSCSHQSCQYRRVPSKKSLPRLEDLGRYQRPIILQGNRKPQ